MSSGVGRIPLPDGKVYHFNVIYNHARSPRSITPDTELSREFTERVVTTLESLGFVNSYYHERDSRVGGNVFQELFRVVEGSDYTIAVLTPGFVSDCWRRYIQMASFKTLLDAARNHKFLPVAVGLGEGQIPQELTTEVVLFFQEDWERDELSWNRLKRVFNEHLSVPVVYRNLDLPLVEAFEETNAPGSNRPDEFDGDPNCQSEAFVPLHPESTANGNNLNHPDAQPTDPEVTQGGTNSPGRSGFGRNCQSTAADQDDPRPDESNASNSHTRTVNTRPELLTEENNAQTARSAAQSNQGIYADVSMDLERRQATERERTRDGEQTRAMPGGHEGTWMDRTMSLSMDQDIESRVVDRLQRNSISDYRDDLIHQTYRKVPVERRDAENLNQGVQNLGQGVQNPGNNVEIQSPSILQGGDETESNTSPLPAEDQERRVVNEDNESGADDTATLPDQLSTESSSSSYVYTGDLTPESLRLQKLCGNEEGASFSTHGSGQSSLTEISETPIRNQSEQHPTTSEQRNYTGSEQTSADPVSAAVTELSPVEDSGRGTGDTSPETNSGFNVYSLVSTPEEGFSESLNSNNGLGSKELSPTSSSGNRSNALPLASEEVLRAAEVTCNLNDLPQISSDGVIDITEESQESVGGSQGFVQDVQESVEERSSSVASENLGTVPPMYVETEQEDDALRSDHASTRNINQEQPNKQRDRDIQSVGPKETTRQIEEDPGARGWVWPVLRFLLQRLPDRW